ncbi:hypothetical protein NW762_006425 [Fusarium torreyae]|uniref:Uncharacterized protein n=1 Tax=Fusarium torreyae TaxID=1237075 RepID=A0A9W8S425_9HYPO|nr:hypothetical protein NW762_006425 [Fusarium torreyae]
MPGLIRRLIAPQRSQPNPRVRDRDRNDDLTDSCEDLSSCCTKKSSQRKNKNAQSRLPVPKKKAIGATPVTIRRVPDVHRVANPVPPIPPHPPHPHTYTPRLRAPSVSSSRCEGRNAALEALTSNDPTNRRAAPVPEPVLCSGLFEHGRTHPHSSHYSHSSQSSRYLRPPRSRNGPLNPVSDAHAHVHAPPRPERPSPEASILSLSDHGVDGYEVGPTDWPLTQSVYDAQSLGSSSDSVDRLFRETDEAFKALGSALRDTQRASQLSALAPQPPSPPGIPVSHKHSKSMPLPTGFQKHSRWRGEDSPSTSSPRSSPDRRSSVVKKPQRKKNNLVGHPFSKAAIRTPRWTLSENVTDILTGQRFRRIEADEMLTPDRIEEVRKKREAAQQLEEERMREQCPIDSPRSMASDNSETDIEPFHLDELASRIRARQAVENPATSVEATPPAPGLTPDLELVHRDVSKQGSVAGDDESTGSSKDKSDSSPDSSPQLPPKNPARFGAEALEKLPSIPEVMGDKTQKELLADAAASNNTDLKVEENDEFFYLKSTPFTLTKPSFRHGPITLSKAEVGKGAKMMDDTLDWTAFQMAILGGAGDFFQDMSNEEDTKQVEEITSWFDTFGFETYGTLIPEDLPEDEPEPVPSMRSSSHSTVSSTPSTINTDIDLPIPVGAEFPSGFWNAPAPGQSLDKTKFFNSTGLKRWVGEGGPKRPSSHSSEGSLPPSPMMPLVVHMADGEADIPDTVPMGYNLGHDLGDFLKWEAENVYASGFSISP